MKKKSVKKTDLNSLQLKKNAITGFDKFTPLD